MSIPRQFVLPFVIQSEKRKETFSNEAEAATIFVLSELERKNSKIANKQETNAYILKIGYPLWLIVKGELTYVFDGLNITKYDWTYYETSQIDEIFENFEASFRIHEQYIEFLDKYKDVQQNTSTKKLVCRGLIADNTMLNEIDIYRKEATESYSYDDKQAMGLLLPALKEADVTKIVNHIETLQLTFIEKTEKIKQLPELILKNTKKIIEGFNFEAKAISEEAEAKIKAQKETITPKIEKITQEYKKQTELLEKNIDKETEPLEKQKKHIEKIIKEREKNIERYSKQAKTQEQRSNRRSEEALKRKIKREKQEHDELQNQHKKIEKQLKDLEEQRTNETLKLKNKFDEKIRTERKPISTIEEQRDEKQEYLKQESNKLEKLTQNVIEELDNFITQQKKRLTNMKQLTLESDLKLKNNSIIYIPFYITAYKKTSTNSKRYNIFSPSLANSLGFSSKLKGALRMTKVKDLLNERFKTVSTLGEKLLTETSSNTELESQIETLTQKNNILNMKTPLKNGLLQLKEEGWLSESDYQIINATINTEHSP
ncbi:MAG: hypothetical protein FWC33_07025 [Candidatus Bathyarchaeota archaeon]|nr:hypothetical protein [Candidatus Termiticorpusculum sp.]